MVKMKSFLMKISDLLVEMKLPGLSVKIILLFMNMSKGKNRLYLRMSTLKYLLDVKNSDEITKALDSLYKRKLLLLMKTEKRGRHNIYHWYVDTKLWREPFFCIPAHHIAQLINLEKHPGRLMNLSTNEIFLWLWMHREFSRVQIGGYDFRDPETGWGYLEFNIKDAERDLGFRIFSRLLEKMQEKGFVRIQDNPAEGKRCVLIFEPHFKPSEDPDQEKMRSIRLKDHNESNARINPEPVDSGRREVSKRLNIFSRREPTIFLESDPELEKEVYEQIKNYGFSDKEEAGFRKLLRKSGPHLVQRALEQVERSGQEVNHSSVKEMVLSLEREYHSESQEDDPDFDDERVAFDEDKYKCDWYYKSIGDEINPNTEFDDLGRIIETIRCDP